MHAPLRILLVEDEALLAIELEALLTDAGHEVVGWATSSAEALTLTAATHPDLAFVDLQLSDGDSGVALAATIREIANSDVVFLTANVGCLPEDYGGAIGVIPKPYSVSGIRSALQYLHEGLRTPPPHGVRPSSLSLSPSYDATWGVQPAGPG